MDLKSRMSLDISNVTKNLSRVATASSNLAKRMASTFKQASDTLARMNTNAIKPLKAAVDKVRGSVDTFLNRLKAAAYTGSKSVKDLTEKVKKSGVQFKDVARIVQGILISKVFYGTINSIRAATGAVWEFAKSLEYSKLVYTNFFGLSSEAQNFTNVLQNFAAKTRFNFEQLNTAAQQLLAYGFQAKNLMYVLKGVSAAASISGDASKIEAISRALGQIQTKGRLMGEEMRQLAEAGIPAYTILQEKLGLSYKQMQKLGDESIPASKAINALIEGINERFGGLLDNTNTSLLGLTSNITDIWLQLASQVFQPAIQTVKSFLRTVMDALSSIRDVYSTAGLGGIFEAIVPPELQGTIRAIIANIITLFQALGSIGASVMAVVNSLMPTLLSWLNIIIGTLASLAKISAMVWYAITSNKTALAILTKVLMITAAAWLAYRVQIIAAMVSKAMISIVSKLSSALGTLSQVLTKLAQHPFIFLAVILTGILLALTGSFDKVRNAVNNLFNSFNTVKTNKLLQPKEMGDSANAVDKYSEKLDGMSDAMQTASDKANKASKAFLSFDEVFSSLDSDSDADPEDTITEQWKNFLSELSTGDVDVDGLLSGIDVSDFAEPFVGSLIDEFTSTFAGVGTRLKEGLIKVDFGNMAVGAVVGAVAIAAGGASGLFVAAAALIIAAFWDDIVEAFGIEQDNKFVGNAMATAIGGAIGGVMGGVSGAIIGAAIALLATQLESNLWEALAEKFGTDQTTGSAELGSAITAGIGGVIGGILGGPGGAIMGAAIGSLVGGLIGLFVDYFIEKFNVYEHAIQVADEIAALLKSIEVGEVGKVLEAAWDLAKAIVKEVVYELFRQFSIEDPVLFGAALAIYLTDAGETAVTGAEAGMKFIIDKIVEKLGEIRTNIETFLADLVADVILWLFPFIAPVVTVFDDIISAIDTAKGDIKELIEKLWAESVLLTATSLDHLLKEVKDHFIEMGVDTATKFAEIKKTIEDTWDDILEYVVPFLEDLLVALVAGFVLINEDTIKYFGDVKDTVEEKLGPLVEYGTKVFKDLKDALVIKMAGIVADVILYFGKIYDTITGKFSKGKKEVGDTLDGLDTDVDTKLEKVRKTAAKILGLIYTEFKTWSSNLWDNVFSGLMGWLDSAISKINEFFGLKSSVDTSSSYTAPAVKAPEAAPKVPSSLPAVPSKTPTKITAPKTGVKIGHATGGIFNREHVARFAEDNKAEAIIPLQNYSAMKPFVDSVSDGITQSLAPIIASINSNNNSLPPMWVGALIADERGLKELNRKFTVLNAAESVRRGEVYG